VSYLRNLCLLAHSGVQHILCCGFKKNIIRLMYPLLLISLDCPFVFAVYFKKQEPLSL
jgi:hypothetical protein